MLELIDKAGALIVTMQAWFLTQSLPVQIVVGAAALAVLWFLYRPAGDPDCVPCNLQGVVSDAIGRGGRKTQKDPKLFVSGGNNLPGLDTWINIDGNVSGSSPCRRLRP
jgi:hypothetical protein